MRVLIAATAAVVLLAGAVERAAANPFRVCLDPENPPFSMAEGEQRGIYFDLATRIAERLGRPLEVVWWPTAIGKRAIRLKLLSGECEAMMGVPFVKGLMGPKVKVAGPLLDLGYAFVFREETPIRDIGDLAGRRVAVVFNTSAANALATRDDIEIVTVREPEAALELLLDERVDAAFVWDAVAGWYDRTRAKGKLYLVGIEGPRMRWQSAIGVARGNEALRDRLQEMLPDLALDIDYLSKLYGLGLDATIRWDWLAAAAAPSGSDDDLRRGGKEPGLRRAALSGDTEQGRRLFDAVFGCAHCHGPGAVAPDRPRDLRRMRDRYGAKWPEVYWRTVLEGRTRTRSGLVMPAWKDAASREELSAILAWLDSIQRSE